MVARKVHSLEIVVRFDSPQQATYMLNTQKCELNDERNTGILPPCPKPLDYIAGVESGILYEVRNDSGVWSPLMSDLELQFRAGIFDTMSCTNFGTLKAVQGQINWLLKNKKIPQDKLMLMQNLGYFDQHGLVNFSERFNAITSGTTSQGNLLQNPSEAIRKFGLLPEADLPNAQACNSFDEWIDPKVLTQAHYDKAKRFLEIFDLKYEWIVTGEEGKEDVFMRHLKQAPVLTAVGTCAVWNEPEGVILDPCPQKQINHAVTLVSMVKDSYKEISDQYVPFYKKLGWKFYMLWGLKIVVTVKETAKPTQLPAIRYNFPRNLKEGDSGYDVNMLQQVLQREVPDVFNLKNTTNFYGVRTEAGVKALQEKYRKEILEPAGVSTPTGNFGEFTRAFINKKYNN